MLSAQFAGSDGLGDATGVRALQTTLRALGDTSISVSGTVDGPTAAAVYKLIRDKGGQIPGLPSDIKAAFDKVKSFDSTLNQYTFGKFDSTSLLRYSSTVISAVRPVNDTAANGMQTGVNGMFAAINKTAAGLNVAFQVLMKPSTPPASTQPSTSYQPPTAQTRLAILQAIAAKNAAGSGTTPPDSGTGPSTLPLGLTKGQLIALVLVAFGVGAVIMKQRAPRSA